MVTPYASIQKARENSVRKFKEKGASARKVLALELKHSRVKDLVGAKVLQEGPGQHNWGLSFSAGLSEVNRYYGMNLTKEVTRHLQKNPSYRLLEVGCGAGNCAKDLAKQFGGRIAITATGLKRVPSWDKKVGVDWRLIHAQNLLKAFKPESFNFIHSNLGISHSKDLAKTVQDCRALLKKGGRLLFTTDIGSHSYLEEIHFEGFKILQFDEKNKKSKNPVWVYYLEKL